MIYRLAFYSSVHYAGVAIGSVVSLASAPLASGMLERLVDGRSLSRWWMLAAGLGITVIAAVLVILAVAPTNAADSGGSAGPDPSRGPEDQQRAPMPVP